MSPGSSPKSRFGSAVGPQRGQAIAVQFGPATGGGEIGDRVVRRNGFSFIELVIATAIMMVLASAALRWRAQISVRKKRSSAATSEMRLAIDAYNDAVTSNIIGGISVTGTEGYPPDLETLVNGSRANSQSGAKIKFLRRIPIDPMTGSAMGPWRGRQARPSRQAAATSTTCSKPRARRSTVRNTGTGHHEGFLVGVVPLRYRSVRSQLRGTTRPRSAQAGWTMIELLIVISIILILAAMSLTTYRNSVTLAKEAALKSDLFIMHEAIDQYYADKGKYPESLQALVSESYLRTVPKDPFTDTSDSWQTEEAEPQPGSNSAEPGIYKVKSGAGGTAIDGSRYADW